MASPVDAARTGTNIATAATSHTINVGSPSAGDLLIVFVRFAGAPGTVTFTGYTQFAADTSDASDDDTRLYYRWADGSEGASDAMSTANSIKLATICWRITGAENPATTAPSVSSVVIGTAANVDPGVVGPTALDFLTGTASGTNLNGGTGTQEAIATSFTATGATLSSISISLAKIGSPTDNVVVEIQADSGGSPSGVTHASVGTIAASSLSGSYADQVLPVSISVTSGNTYWIVLTRSGARDTSNAANWEIASSAYSGGVAKNRSSGTWGSALASDKTFAIQYAAADYLFLTVIGLDSETATATQPAGYGNLAAANSGTGGAVATNCMIWGASKQATAASDDPGAWTSTAPNAGVTAWTIAIPPPAAPAAPGPTAAFFKPPLRRRASRYLTFR